MAYKSADDIQKPEARFEGLVILEGEWHRPMPLFDHHTAIGRVVLSGSVPAEVRDAYDRARNTMLYAFFDYDFLMVGEIQAYGAFELAHKHRIKGHGGESKGSMRNLVDQARKVGIFLKLAAGITQFDDPVEAMIALRNSISHGNSQIHSSGMALEVLDSSA